MSFLTNFRQSYPSLTIHPSHLLGLEDNVLTDLPGKQKGEYTHGHLTIDGIHICDTLENANACAPAGQYSITLIRCKQYARKWFDWLERNTDFDQLILETANGKDFWIHVSCRKNRKKNRHQVIRYLRK